MVLAVVLVVFEVVMMVAVIVDLLVVVVELRRFLLDLLVLLKLSRRQRPKLRTLTPAASAAERLG